MVGLYYCSDLCRLCRHNKTSRTSRRSHYFRKAWMKSVHLSNFRRSNVHFTSFLYICINNLAKVKSIHGDFIKFLLCWHKPQKTQTIQRNVPVVGVRPPAVWFVHRLFGLMRGRAHSFFSRLYVSLLLCSTPWSPYGAWADKIVVHSVTTCGGNKIYIQ